MKFALAATTALLFFSIGPGSAAFAKTTDSPGVAAAAAPQTTRIDSLTAQVRATEAAFARTMADRKLDAFGSYVSDEAIFGGKNALRGKAAVVTAWKRFFEGDAAPFSWEPEIVEVLDSGTLALSSGPVKDPTGKQIGTFNSIWRRGPDGAWKIIFDKGCPPCDCPEKP